MRTPAVRTAHIQVVTLSSRCMCSISVRRNELFKRQDPARSVVISTNLQLLNLCQSSTTTRNPIFSAFSCIHAEHISPSCNCSFSPCPDFEVELLSEFGLLPDSFCPVVTVVHSQCLRVGTAVLGPQSSTFPMACGSSLHCFQPTLRQCCCNCGSQIYTHSPLYRLSLNRVTRQYSLNQLTHSCLSGSSSYFVRYVIA